MPSNYMITDSGRICMEPKNEEYCSFVFRVITEKSKKRK